MKIMLIHTLRCFWAVLSVLFSPCKIDEGVYLAFAGISADGRVLASKMRLECQSYRYSMGAAPSVGYIARYVGEPFELNTLSTAVRHEHRISSPSHMLSLGCSCQRALPLGRRSAHHRFQQAETSLFVHADQH